MLFGIINTIVVLAITSIIVNIIVSCIYNIVCAIKAKKIEKRYQKYQSDKDEFFKEYAERQRIVALNKKS